MEKAPMNVEEARKRLESHFGSRTGMLGSQLIHLSMSGQPTDITFFRRKPILDVKVDEKIHIALMYGAGAKKLQEILQSIRLSNGETISFDEIWTVNPMPHDGFKPGELESVDLAKGEEVVGENGETVRKMISDTYHCENKEQEDRYLRRFLAS